MVKFLRINILILVLLLANTGFSQNITSRITVLSGSSVQLPFNSYTKIANGISYNNWTQIQIYYLDTLDDGTNNTTSQWHLMVRANSATIDGDGGSSMPLDKVELEVSNISPASSGASAGRITLTNTDQEIVRNGANPTNTATVTISYYIGQNAGGTNSLLGETPDYYFVDLIFTLEQQP